MVARFHALDPNSRGAVDRVGQSGADVSEPEEHLVPNVEAFNKDPKRPFTIKVAVPAEFEAVASRRADRTVFKGELNPIFQGIYSSRIELKGWMRTIERQLLAAEKLGVLAGWLGTPADPAAILAAWEPALFNQTHDLASGVMTDHVYEDTIRSYEYSRRRSEVLIDASWNVLASRIDTRGPGTPIVVFNPLGWTRSDVAEVEVGFGEGGVAEVELTDPDGQAVPVQILDATRYADGGLKTARIAFIARDVPALGYATYHAAPGRRPAGPATRHGDGLPAEIVLENELYRVTVDRATGAMIGVHVKAGDWDVLSGRGNVVARQQDRGDLWELNRGLDGGSRIAMTTKQPVPKRGQAAFSDEGKGQPGTVRTGPVFAEFQVERAFGPGKFATAVRLYNGLRRIEVTTRLVNGEKYVRYQVLFPTSIATGKTTHEIPFGAIERPASIEFPAQNWADHGDGRHGLALLEHRPAGQPDNRRDDDDLAAPLAQPGRLRVRGRVRAGDVVGVGLPGRPGADDALCPGPPRRRLARGGRLSRRPGVQPSPALPRGAPACRQPARPLGSARGLEPGCRRLGAQAGERGRRPSSGSTRRPGGPPRA